MSMVTRIMRIALTPVSGSCPSIFQRAYGLPPFPSPLNGIALNIVSTWPSQDFWTELVDRFCKIFSQPIRIILERLAKQADLVEEIGLAGGCRSVKSDMQWVVGVWCGFGVDDLCRNIGIVHHVPWLSRDHCWCPDRASAVWNERYSDASVQICLVSHLIWVYEEGNIIGLRRNLNSPPAGIGKADWSRRRARRG